MNKKAMITTLSVMLATIVTSIALVFTVGPRVSAMNITPMVITLGESDFKIQDGVLYGLKANTMNELGSIFYKNYSANSVQVYVNIPEGVTKIVGSNGNSILRRAFDDNPVDYNGDGIYDTIGWSGAWDAYGEKIYINLPSTLEEIGEYALYQCNNVTNLKLPSSLTTIGDYALDMKGLMNITIPANVTTVGESIFGDAITGRGAYEYNLSEVNVENPDLWKNENLKQYYTGAYLFDNPDYFEIDENGVLTGLSALGVEIANDHDKLAVVIPEGVTALVGHRNDSGTIFNAFTRTDNGNYFWGSDFIVSVDLPDSLNTIGDYAFFNCWNYNFKTITIPANVTEIGVDAFFWCDFLHEINVENPTLLNHENLIPFLPVTFDDPNYFNIDENGVLCGLSEAGAAYAQQHHKLNVVIPDGVTAINSVHDTITNSYYSAFARYVYVEIDNQEEYWDFGNDMISISLPNSLKTIGDHGLAGVFNRLEIPSGVTSIGENGISGWGATEIILPNTLESIGDCAFGNCENLVSITLPASVNQVGQTIFAYNHNYGKLKEIIVGDAALINNPNMAPYVNIMHVEKYYTVNFNVNGGSAVDNVVVNKNEITTEPITTRDGYTFLGWFNGNDAYNFATPVTADLNLTAHWQINSYTITFDSGVAAQTVNYGALVTKPTDPIKANHTFLGWYKDAEFTTAFDFTAPVTKDENLYAKFGLNKFAVTFNPFNGDNLIVQEVESGAKATMPTAPIRENYLFQGWYITETEEFDFDSAITANTTVTAKWKPASIKPEPLPENPVKSEEQIESNNTAMVAGIAGGSVAGLGSITAILGAVVSRKRRK